MRTKYHSRQLDHSSLVLYIKLIQQRLNNFCQHFGEEKLECQRKLPLSSKKCVQPRYHDVCRQEVQCSCWRERATLFSLTAKMGRQKYFYFYLLCVQIPTRAFWCKHTEGKIDVTQCINKCSDNQIRPLWYWSREPLWKIKELVKTAVFYITCNSLVLLNVCSQLFNSFLTTLLVDKIELEPIKMYNAWDCKV